MKCQNGHPRRRPRASDHRRDGRLDRTNRRRRCATERNRHLRVLNVGPDDLADHHDLSRIELQRHGNALPHAKARGPDEPRSGCRQIANTELLLLPRRANDDRRSGGQHAWLVAPIERLGHARPSQAASTIGSIATPADRSMPP
jgi:hypothetical protein